MGKKRHYVEDGSGALRPFWHKRTCQLITLVARRVNVLDTLLSKKPTVSGMQADVAGIHRLLFGVCLFVAWLTALAQPATARPARIVTEYALTSANNGEYADPADWRLLGSNDGESWEQLDRQTNQAFAARSQRRVFAITNRAAYRFYRLRVERAGIVQLGELELTGPAVGVTNENDLFVKATSSGSPPLTGAPDNAFDGDPSTRWIDFNNGKTFDWLQCEYTANPEILVTNVGQFVVLARRLAARNPLLDNAPQILSNVTAWATRPARALTAYALTSANDSPQRDPRDWRLLGSNDGGKTWNTLDKRSAETFGRRFQRRVFTLTNQAACAIYRLQIDCVRAPEPLANAATCVQLAGIEPIYDAKESGARYSLAISTQGDNPPNESAEMAFDDKPETKWLDFADGRTNRSSWIQWQYLPFAGAPVFDVSRLRAVRSRPPQPMIARLEGVIVSWDPASHAAAFLDETGFQMFDLGSSVVELHPGDQIRLSGTVRLNGAVPALLNPEIGSLGTLPSFAELRAGERVEGDNHFFTATIEGRAIAASDALLHLEIRLASDDGSGHILAHLLKPKGVRIPHFTNCRLRVHGVVEAVFDGSGDQVAGTIWIASPDDVTLPPPKEEEWGQWPEFSIQRLLTRNSSAAPGTLLRVHGRVGAQSGGKTLILSDGTNQLTASCEEMVSLSPGDPVEVAGFFDKEGATPSLRWARLRAGAIRQLIAAPSQTRVINQRHPVTEIGEILDLAKTMPPTNFPVSVRGVITYVDLSLNDFYLQNGADGVLCMGQFSAGLAPFLRQEGLYVECKGTANTAYPVEINSGGFVTVLGKGQWPEPRRASWNDLMSGSYDSQWVEVEGVVSVVEKQRLTIIVAGGQLVVWINEMDKDCRDRLLGSLVRVHGVCAPLLNSRRQRLGQRLLVPSIEHLEMVKAAPENPFDLPVVRISRIMRYSEDTNRTVHLVKTTGVVTHKEPQLLFVQDGSDGLRVETRDLADAEPGDRVEVVGLPAPDGFSPKLVQALLKVKGHGSLPAVAPIDLLGADADGEGGDQDATRRSIDGTLLGRSFKESLEVLELRHDPSKKTFFAYLPLATDTNNPVPTGSRLRLEGVFKAKMDSVADYGQTITSFEMYLNSPADITVLERPSWWTARHTVWLLGGVGVLLVMFAAWVGSLRNRVRQRTGELREEIGEHKRTYTRLEEKTAALEKEAEERRQMEKRVADSHRELLVASRRAGMAEVATNVLHNVGNVLNSVNVSANLVSDQLRESKIVSVARAAALMRDHSEDLAEFITKDPKGRQLPAFLTQLGEHLAGEKTSLSREIESLKNNVEHIKEIVAMQQSYAKVSGLTEIVKVTDLVEDALRMNAGALVRHDVQIFREYDPHLPEINVEKHKVLQILVNLVQNAKYACDEAGHDEKRMTVRVSNGDDLVRVSVIDNGVGIAEENLTKIFNHGFTTRKDGHGFGLHSGALAIKELGGSLRAQSDGPGKGATFTLELPVSQKN